jgi:small redox-active disulfide protein 2
LIAPAWLETEEFIMLIKILGSGCAKCNRLEQLTREVVAELGVEATFEHVKEIDKIMAYPIMTTPALVVDEKVKVSGRIPGKDELRGWLK